MNAENKIPETVENSIMEQIAFHKQKIADWEFTLKMLKENPPPVVSFIAMDETISRNKIRTFMRNINKPVRTVDIIDLLYPKTTEERKRNLIKVASVILNILEKNGEVSIEKREGVKGNYYHWVKKWAEK